MIPLSGTENKYIEFSSFFWKLVSWVPLYVGAVDCTFYLDLANGISCTPCLFSELAFFFNLVQEFPAQPGQEFPKPGQEFPNPCLSTNERASGNS